MRPLTHQDYLLIAIVALTAFAGFCAVLVVVYNLLQAIRERRQPRDGPKVLVTPSRLSQRSARAAYRASVVRH